MVGLLVSDQEYAISLTQAGTLHANGGPSFAYKPGTNATAPQTLLVQTINQGGTATTLGTISISTAGSVTPPTHSCPLQAARVLKTDRRLSTQSCGSRVVREGTAGLDPKRL